MEESSDEIESKIDCEIQSVNEDQTSKMKQLKISNCYICLNEFSSKNDKDMHMEKEHGLGLVDRFTPEFKIDAVKRSDEIGLTRAARELNIATSSLRRWVLLTSKPLHCSVCNKKFAHERELEKHEKTHQKNLSTEEYVMEENHGVASLVDSFTGEVKFEGVEDRFTEEFKINAVKRYNEIGSTRAAKESNIASSTLRRWVLLMSKPLLCSVCSKKFAHERELKEHNKTHLKSLNLSTEENFKPNSSIPEMISQNSYIEMNSKSGNEKKTHVYAPTEDKELKENTMNGMYVQEQQQLNEKNFVCEYCGKQYFKKKNRNEHVKLVHELEKKFCCFVCGKKFPKKSYLIIHERTHTGEKPHQCEICQKGFARTGSLKYHRVNVHGIEVTFKCDDCPKIFHRKDQLTAHVRTHSELYVCNEKTKGDGKTEKWNQSFKEEAVKMARETSFDESCTQNNITRYILGRWIKLIENPITCEVCSKPFAHRSKFRKHMLSHFPESLICEICSKTFGNRGTFVKHMKSHYLQDNIPQMTDSKPDLRDLYLKKYAAGEETKDDGEEMLIDENMVKVELLPHAPKESKDNETSSDETCSDAKSDEEKTDSVLVKEEEEMKENILETFFAEDLDGMFVQEQQQLNEKK
eukprot:GFUD01002724.1.p1 GENE.GFUD01002724.1~~GFUD01002724.1.p1  ORF type:complete len:636 (-),score=134.04 GFUD01002724.1:75-1982(-)